MGYDYESFLLDKQFKDEFTKFCEKISIEEQTISSNYVEKMEHIDQNCEDRCDDYDSLLLDKQFEINSLKFVER